LNLFVKQAYIQRHHEKRDLRTFSGDHIGGPEFRAVQQCSSAGSSNGLENCRTRFNQNLWEATDRP
jgi:hypothetical protein